MLYFSLWITLGVLHIFKRGIIQWFHPNPSSGVLVQSRVGQGCLSVSMKERNMRVYCTTNTSTFSLPLANLMFSSVIDCGPKENRYLFKQ